MSILDEKARGKLGQARAGAYCAEMHKSGTNLDPNATQRANARNVSQVCQPDPALKARFEKLCEDLAAAQERNALSR